MGGKGFGFEDNPQADFDVESLPSSGMTVADQIRYLDRRGWPRAAISRALGKRYQHVRNVLEADRIRDQAATTPAAAPRTPHPKAAPPGGPPGPYRLVVGADGTVRLPEALRTALGVDAGGVLVGRLQGRDLSLTDGLTAARRARDLVSALIPGDDSLADSLIADRRREAAREARD